MTPVHLKLLRRLCGATSGRWASVDKLEAVAQGPHAGELCASCLKEAMRRVCEVRL